MENSDLADTIVEAAAFLQNYIDDYNADSSSELHKKITSAVNEFFLVAQRLPMPTKSTSTSGNTANETACPRCGQVIYCPKPS